MPCLVGPGSSWVPLKELGRDLSITTSPSRGVRAGTIRASQVPVRGDPTSLLGGTKHGAKRQPTLEEEREGHRGEGRGAAPAVGGWLLCLSGTWKSGGRTLLPYSGTIRRMKRKPRTEAGLVAT